jgi:hypothetical protein
LRFTASCVCRQVRAAAPSLCGMSGRGVLWPIGDDVNWFTFVPDVAGDVLSMNLCTS